MAIVTGFGLTVAVWLTAELIYAVQLAWENRQARREVEAFLRSDVWRAPPR